MQVFLKLPPVRFVLDVADVYFSRRAARSAAELAYFLILSIFPLLICVNAFIGVLQVNITGVLNALEHILPAETLHILREYLGYLSENQSAALLSVGVAATLAPASAALRALMTIMDDIYGTQRYRGLRGLAASLVFSFLLLLTIYLSMVLLFTGNWFFRQIERFFHLQSLLPDWEWMRFVLLFLLLFLFVLILYRMTVPRTDPRPPIISGAFLSSVVLVAASILFSWFISLFANYSLVYGSLASMIVLLIWLYLCGNVLILGNVVNYVLYRRRIEG